MKYESEHDSIAGHERRNRELVSQILANGGCLTVTRVLDLFFCAPSQMTGTSLAEALRVLGLTNLEVSPPEDGASEWYVSGQLQASVQHMTSAQFTEELVKLAARHDSDYDGWGTEL